MGNPVSAMATFAINVTNTMTGAGTVTITLENLQVDSSKSNQCISGFAFTLTGTPQPLANSLTGSAVHITIASDGSFPAGTLPGTASATTRWSLISPPSNNMTALGGAQPSEMIIGPPGTLNMNGSGQYAVSGNFQTQFNPFLYRTATFTLTYTSGLSSSTDVTAAIFTFGTGPDANITGTPHDTPAVPEPATAVMAGIGLASLGLFKLRRRNSNPVS
jgi:hypothetical protein